MYLLESMKINTYFLFVELDFIFLFTSLFLFISLSNLNNFYNCCSPKIAGDFCRKNDCIIIEGKLIFMWKQVTKSEKSEAKGQRL